MSYVQIRPLDRLPLDRLEDWSSESENKPKPTPLPLTILNVEFLGMTPKPLHFHLLNF